MADEKPPDSAEKRAESGEKPAEAGEQPAEAIGNTAPEDADRVEAESEAQLREVPLVRPDLAVHAGFWTRLAAALIDTAIVVAVLTLLAGAFWVFDNGTVPLSLAARRQTPGAFALYWILAALLILGYNTFNIAATGQTAGKQVMGLMVLRQDGVSVTPREAAVRALAALLSTLPLGLGFWVVLWDKDRRAWHDRIAGTDVVALDERLDTD